MKNYFAYTKEDIYEIKIKRGHKNLFMNYKETIYVMKVINDFNRKEVDYVARRPAPNVDRPRRSVKFCSPRRPQSRSSWRRSNGRPDRWGSVTMGACKGSHQ